MPFVGEKERLIIFSKKEWEKLPEFNFGSWVEKEDGVEIQERRIIIHNVQLLVEEEVRDVYFLYMNYHDEKGEEKVERLPRLSRNFSTQITQGETGETVVIEQQDYSGLIEFLRRNERISRITDKVDELQISDNRGILTRIKIMIDIHHNLPRGLFPIPVLIRGKKFRDKSYNVNRLTYTIIDLSVTPQYLGECKYRG